MPPPPPSYGIPTRTVTGLQNPQLPVTMNPPTSYFERPPVAYTQQNLNPYMGMGVGLASDLAPRSNPQNPYEGMFDLFGMNNPYMPKR